MTSLSEAWMAFDQDGPAFWNQMGDLASMLDGVLDEGPKCLKWR